jgi:glucose-6-phosphate dehydrogenase assembly protein OpcA
MESPSDLKAALWGAAGGAAVLAAVAFMWAGWVAQRTAEAKARQLASGQPVSTMARKCVDKYRQQVGVAENGGWATLPSTRPPDSRVARACAEVLVEDR